MVAFCLRHAVFWCGAVAASGAASSPSSRDGHALGAAQIEARVAATLRGLSVAEKARQLDIFRAADMLTDGRLDPAKAAASWGDLRYECFRWFPRHVSLSRVPPPPHHRASLGIGTLHDFYPSPELANDAARFLLNASRSRVPPLVGGEATHGLQMDGHTIFPSPIGLAATFDPDLMRDYGAVVAREARTSGVHVTWNPVLGLCREVGHHGHLPTRTRATSGPARRHVLCVRRGTCRRSGREEAARSPSGRAIVRGGTAAEVGGGETALCCC